MAATVAGTPLFAAPEIMRGEEYGASCDVYSFGVMLLELASSDGLLPFLRQRWRESQVKSGAESSNVQRTKQAQNDVDERQAMAMMRSIWQGNFRPVVLGGPPVPNAPPSVSTLIVRCTLHDPAARPPFSEVLTVLANNCAQEAEAFMYIRGAESASRGVEGARGNSQEVISIDKTASSAATSSEVQAHIDGRTSTNKTSTSIKIAIGPDFELELELIQTQMTQKPMLRAEVYARALRASQNRKEDSV